MISAIHLLSKNKWVGALAVIALAGIICSGVLRTFSALKVTAMPPGVSITSGCEEESMFAVWRAAHDQLIWLDLTQPPYASAYFNWLFYQSYGAVVKPAIAHNGGPGLIRHSRIFTLAGSIVGACCLSLLAWRLSCACPLALRLCALVLACSVFLGPLTGWWIVTIRPDIWALTAECLGVVVLLLGWRQVPIRAALVSALCFYLSWAFKQNYVQGVGIALLFLLSYRQWRMAALLAVPLVLSWGLTLWLLGSDYRSSLISFTHAGLYAFEQGVEVFTGAAIRCMPFLPPVLGLILFRHQLPLSRLSQDTLRFVKIGLPLSFIFTFLTSCKLGASTNYYFTTMLLLGLAGMVGVCRLTLLLPTLLALLAVLILSICVLVSAPSNLGAQAKLISEQWSLWETAPSPRFAHDQRLNLPWLNPSAPTFLLAYNYPDDRSAGRKFAHDGIGGLIRDGYFLSLLLPDEVADSYDGAPLTHYERRASKAGVTLWLRRKPAIPMR